MRTRFNIGLTFNEEISNQIVSYSNCLYKLMDSDVILGINSTPHITIGQFYAEQDQALIIWNKFYNNIQELPKVDFAGLTAINASELDIWFEISVLKSEKLLALQQHLLNVLHPHTEMINDSLDKYRPHVTVAHTEKGIKSLVLPQSFTVNRLTSVDTYLEMGIGTRFERLSQK